MKKKIFISIISMLTLAVIWQWEMIGYGIGQAKGQYRILADARPLEEFLTDETPDSVQQKIKLIQEIKAYAIDSLGLNPSGSYTKMYDQQGKPVLWVVTACPKYSLDAYAWDYPFLGEMAYKGFFEKEKAEQLRDEMIANGFDAEMDEVNAWSTLGWFDDPILSNMLKRSDGNLARLIIHELTHGTIFVSGDTEMSENLATFVGDFGGPSFLEMKYGKDSDELQAFADAQADREVFTAYMAKSHTALQELYESFEKEATDSLKMDQLKAKKIKEILVGASELPTAVEGRFDWLVDLEVNNCFFTDFANYRNKQSELEKEFGAFDGDFRAFLGVLKVRYE